MRLLQQLGDKRRPARLMAGAKPSSGIAVEILVKLDVVAPMRISLPRLVCAIDRPTTTLLAQEDVRQARREVLRDLPERALHARAGGTLDEKLVAVVVMEPLQRLNEQKVDGKPDGAAPVRVPTKQPGARLARFIVDGVFTTIHLDHIRMLSMKTAHAADAMLAEKLLGIEHTLQQALHAVAAYQRQQST